MTGKPMQNRVDPFGAIHAVAAYGKFTGNRGVIHDPATRTLLKRRWTTRAWIICDCAYGGLRRDVMGRNTPSGNAGWTELFFLDEPTALAAGHRPCFLCRREKAKEFAGCFGKAFAIAGAKVAEMDARLHAERLASGGKTVALSGEALTALPDGAFVASRGHAYAIRDGRAWRWSFGGYGDAVAPGSLDAVALVTPASTIAVLVAGYAPVWHETACSA